MINLLITGASGQLATALKNILNNNFIIKPIFTNHNLLDITDYHKCLDFFNHTQIDYIINCAAYTAVDLAETNRHQAHLANSLGPLNLAKLANKFNIKLIHLSTDYIFPECKENNTP